MSTGPVTAPGGAAAGDQAVISPLRPADAHRHPSRAAAPMLESRVAPAACVPAHVAVIMDGNGRWAAQRGLPRVLGHERGTDNIRRITYAAGELGIKYLTLWAFSAENWRRPAE